MSTRLSHKARPNAAFLAKTTPTLTGVVFSESRGSRYTKEQCSHGGKKSSAVKREKVLFLIDRALSGFALDCEDRGVKFSLAAFFRSEFPLRNQEALRRGYGAYVKGRLEDLFGTRCDAVNRFKLFCASIIAAVKRRPLVSVVREWIRLGRALSCNPLRRSLDRPGVVWNPSTRFWEVSLASPASSQAPF